MQNAKIFREKLKSETICFGTGSNPGGDTLLTEFLAHDTDIDFLWIDMEHPAITIETVDNLIMATRNSDVAALVRVAWTNPVLVKPILDAGADAIIFPQIQTVEAPRLAISSCLYPPDGIRGIGPGRAALYSQSEKGPNFCKEANESVIIILQIEHIDAVNDIESILAVPGITSIVFGPNDLANSMGYPGQPTHPEVFKAVDIILDKAKQAYIPVGTSIPADMGLIKEWAERGVSWIEAGIPLEIVTKSVQKMSTALKNM